MNERVNRIEELNLSEGPLDAPEGLAEPTIADMMRKMIEMIGEDPAREGLRRTPERFERALRYLTRGYHQDPEKILNGAVFSTCYDQMVVLKDVEMYSLCEHHML